MRGGRLCSCSRLILHPPPLAPASVPAKVHDNLPVYGARAVGSGSKEGKDLEQKTQQQSSTVTPRPSIAAVMMLGERAFGGFLAVQRVASRTLV